MTTNKQANIGVKFSVQGRHVWNTAPPHRQYLGVPHEHLFGFSVEVTVTDDDRQIEFHDLRSMAFGSLHGIYDLCARDPNVIDFAGDSCESIARKLAQNLLGFYQSVTVTVDEDGVCWATVKETKNE